MSLISAMAETARADKYTREQLAAVQQKKLERLVRYARENSPYYRRILDGTGDDIHLSELPVTTKPELMGVFDDVVTDRGISMERIDKFTDDIDNVGRLIDGKYLVSKTSGSTGSPAVVLYDKRCIDVQSAVAALRTFARKEDLKAFLGHGKKTAGVFADHGFYLACGMSRYMQLRMPWEKSKITVDVNAPEEQIVSELNAFGPAMLSGYPSNLALLADNDRLTIRPDVVITGGELLTDEIRRKLEDKFGCYVQTHYSCTEGGEIACECSEGHLHINEDHTILEPVDKDYAPVGSGVMSDMVLLTNLSNFVQPFIRYVLTDRVIVHDEKCACGRSTRWLEIEGRTDDILVFSGGVKIAPMSLYKVLEEVKSIRRFQLVQTTPDAVSLRIISDDRDGAFAAAEHDLTEFFASKGLHIDISLSDEPPQANKVSGKFKHIYSEIC
ncbi:MAG: phenylacetate--CoA ligase family protein [Oscillospiraceae bacterium]|nr:phenylacetate--CoA ligase family protein [Oscillospiraceae bacterium]